MQKTDTHSIITTYIKIKANHRKPMHENKDPIEARTVGKGHEEHQVGSCF
jgi:hypothetical protein